MEILNYYAKILPDDIFKGKKVNQESIEKVFGHVVNQHINTNKISNDSWLKQFEKQTYTRSQPIEQQFTEYSPIDISTTYNVVDTKEIKNDFYNKFGNKELVTDQFFPNTGGYTQIGDQYIPLFAQGKNPIIENFIGMDNPIDRIPRKVEVENMFKPEELLRQNNTYIDVDTVKERLSTSDRTNDKRVTEPQRVPPGFGRSYDDNTQRGIHPTVRVLPKNVDQLRSANNQKNTYLNEITLGQMGALGATTVGETIKKTPDTFIVDRPIEKGRSQNTLPMVSGEYKKDPTRRETNNGSKIGGATLSSNTNRLKMINTEPKTNEYRTPDPLVVSRLVKNQMIQNKEGHLAPFKSRSIHNQNQFLGASGIPEAPVVNYFELPKVTVKDTTVIREPNKGVASGTYEGRAFNPNDKPKDTVKQSLIERNIQLGTLLTSVTDGMRAVNFDDKPRDTTKENSIHRNQETGTLPTYSGIRSVNYNDNVEMGHRESMNNVNNLGISMRKDVSNAVVTDNFYAKDTNRQSTELFTQVNGPGQSTQHAIIDNSYVPRETVKETQVIKDNEKGNSVNSSVPHGYSVDPKDKPKETHRVTMAEDEYKISYGKGLSQEKGFGYNTNKQNIKDTIKETTHVEDYVTNPQKGDGKGYISNPHEFKTTQRQIAVVNTHFNEGGSRSQNYKQTVYEPQNISVINDRNDIFERENQRNPTQVNLAHIPQINTTGSVWMRNKIVEDNRAILPTALPNMPCKPTVDYNADKITSRDNSFYTRFDQDTKFLKDSLKNIELSLYNQMGKS